ncbi:gp53-like domain-containing protein [Salmonella enterica]|uniref:gp53-like domain-containing protein n=1 Tax=Salmonella enterica TaxID=28901 RepID=UPI004037BB6F
MNATGTKNTASKAANGWWKCGSTGLIIQWGYVTSAGNGVTFPIVFPSACQNFTITNAHTRADWCISLNTLSNTGATFYSENNGNMYWSAIGY